METFKECLQHQLKEHPSMQPRDVVKLCYQAVFGAEHLLRDAEGVKHYFQEEYAAVKASNDMPLFERISSDICRVNLGAWKAAGLPSEWLWRMFADTVVTGRTHEDMAAYLQAAESVLGQCVHGFDEAAWRVFKQAYIADGMPAVRHTEQYRSAEQPSYRIVHAKYLRILPVLQQLSRVKAEISCVIALDGRAGAGKSTVAKLLAYVLDAGVAYMDDFFLPPSMRSVERLKQAGGQCTL